MDSCARYVVRHKPHRVRVRDGRFLALVGGGAARAELQVSAFGRMVFVTFLEGPVAATCSDGSQRQLALASPDDLILAAPIRPTGRFEIARAGAGSRIRMSGSFDGGSVAALVDLSNVLPGGSTCRARWATLVGSLAFPAPTVGSGEYHPGSPAGPPQ